MTMHNSKQSGFTLIELLVVIVTIAILAAITVVAYNGIQDRARSASMEASVQHYAKAFELYNVEHQAFPDADWICLGQDSDYPAENGYAAGNCHKGGTYDYPGTSAGVISALSQYMNGSPSPRYPDAPNEFGGIMRGLLYDRNSWDTNTATITYYLTGDEPCPIGTKVYYMSAYNSTRCRDILSGS